MSQAAEQLPVETEKEEGPKLGIFDDIPNEDYHRGPGISKSGLDLIDQSPAHFIELKRHPKPGTKAMLIGSAFHSLVLEPEVFPTEFIQDPTGGSQSNAAKLKRMELELQGLKVLSTKTGENEHWQASDWDTIHRMRDAVMAHPYAATLLDPDQGKAERSVYWIDEETRKLCKCRPDFFNDAHNLIVDLKSTDDASYTGFAKSVAKWRYHVQDAFYSDGVRAAGQRVSGFVFVAVEKSPPYSVGIYKLDPKATYVGRIIYQRNLELYAQCHASNEWPAYPEQIRDLEIPEWGLKGHIS